MPTHLRTVGAVDDATRLGYPDVVNRLGRDFTTDQDAAEAALA
jgi:hypothetical protein